MSLDAANADRTKAAANRTVPKARAALTEPSMRADQRKALKLRAAHPSMSLAELGELAGWTKHRFSGLLRRGLAYAAQMKRMAGRES